MNRGICLYLAFSVLSGTLLALQFHWGAVVLALLLLSIFLRKKTTTILFLCLLFLFISFLNSTIQEKRQKTVLSSEPETVDLQIVINDIPSIDGDSFVSLAQIKNEKVLMRYYFSSEKEKRKFQHVKPGFLCEMKGQLTEPKPNKNPNLFHYKNYLAHRGVYWILDVQAFGGCVDESRWKHALLHLRFDGLKKIERDFPSSTVGVTQALLFGETGMVAEDTMKAFRELGVVHLLAISGLHVGLIFAILYYCLLRIGVTKESVTWICIVFLLCYIVLTGASPSVTRASSMLIVILLSRKVANKLSTIESLSIVFVVLVLYDPYYVFNVGFQLSFMVSFSLVVSSSIILNTSSSISQLVKVTLVAQLSSLPIIIFHFYEFSLIGFFTNLLYVPLFSVIVLPLTILVYILSVEWLILLHRYLMDGIQWVSTIIASFPFSTIVMGKPPFLFLIGYLIAIYVVFVWFEKKKYILSILLLIFWASIHMLINTYNPYGEVVFLDVGQGDATLIMLPYNRGTYLIDTGGEVQFPKEEWEERKNRFSVGEDIVVPFLKSKGVTSIDALILTHGDLDHIGGSEAVLEEMKVKEVLISPNSEEKGEMRKIMKIARKKKVPVKEAHYPYRWAGDNDGLHIVSPQDEEYEGNNDSIVLYGEIGSLKWLFTGDLEEQGEKEFIRNFDLPIDVLKVGHHGSNTSTTEEFLVETNPSVAVISAGETNRFGHPHPEVVERLEIRGITIYSTGENGAITYRFWDKNGTFSAHLP
ncbi:DNA internalization-related competence protein ComEC/Rec2 [Rossellomorea aquimaris]|uniref:DNA internalization-related competence protein ComEC/Rec2 n=1 Tax=Rossellomorea aquimaris TaxID=189382 RepID=A0A5D4UHS9_9BACI|nr:DNA internalization-related competence protein ComEC/Rec2 [Rossellomorea aquimaris]TYS77715.1 DNA internalization-related competence protein ComEC/Rec2 [Rossellomorea aquimaris]TYS86896.1 DNA internalization-related competence protein ComEC/Rec2 [Rossellomorea aquimaris]